ncbi:hypothetical protein D3C73_1157500 [compost metagenome]
MARPAAVRACWHNYPGSELWRRKSCPPPRHLLRSIVLNMPTTLNYFRVTSLAISKVHLQGQIKPAKDFCKKPMEGCYFWMRSTAYIRRVRKSYSPLWIPGVFVAWGKAKKKSALRSDWFSPQPSRPKSIFWKRLYVVSR